MAPGEKKMKAEGVGGNKGKGEKGKREEKKT